MAADPSQGELSAVVEFLAVTSPFDSLPNEQLLISSSKVQAFYCCQGEILNADSPQTESNDLLIIRAGAIDLWAHQGHLIDRLSEGDSLILSSVLHEAEARLVEDCLIFRLPAKTLSELRSRFDMVDQFYQIQQNRRSLKADHAPSEPTDMLRKIDSVMSTKLVSAEASTSIREAAQIMSEHRVSSILITEQEQLIGIVTDRDIRSRAVAKGLDLLQPLAEIMTTEPLSIEANSCLLDATLLMSQKNFHHLPVVKKNASDKKVPIGMITASDLMLARENDPVLMAQRLGRQKTVEGLSSIVNGLPSLVVQWQRTGIQASHISHLLTAISETITRRLIDIGIEKFGQPPVPFCWLGFGSQGRGEQLLGADQDNGIVIDDSMQPEDEKWFEELADFVCHGLAKCGYILCPGDIMAMNPLWRLPLKGWRKTVSNWAVTPTPDAVMRVSIFFDIKAIYGDESLAQQLQSHMLSVVKGNQRFLAALAENVLTETPPLGLFRRFVVEPNGEHAHELDLKKRGLLPLIEIARIHALANNINAVNTKERIKALVEKQKLTAEDGQNLLDALKLITQLRLQNQAEQVQQGNKVSNYLDPDHLSQLQRRQLKDAFSIAADGQRGVKTAYMPSM